MKNFFNYENKVMSTIGAIADSIFLGILWVLCSLPVLTIGASSSAFYYAYNKCICQKTGRAWQTFFAGFKSNFKQATLIWLIVLGLAVFFFIDYRLLSLMENAGVLTLIIQVILIVAMVFLILWMLYLFPFISRFQTPTKAAMKNCALIAVANIPQSILLLIVFVITAVIFVCLPILNLLLPAFYIFCANKILEKVFRKYMSPEDLAAQTADTEA